MQLPGLEVEIGTRFQVSLSVFLPRLEYAQVLDEDTHCLGFLYLYFFLNHLYNCAFEVRLWNERVLEDDFIFAFV